MKRPSSSSVMKASAKAKAMKAMKGMKPTGPSLRDKQGYLYKEWVDELRDEFEQEKNFTTSFKVRNEKTGRPVFSLMENNLNHFVLDVFLSVTVLGT